jgi:hypothetical protein
LTGPVLLGLERRKLCLPVAQDVSLDADQFTDLADLEEELVGDLCWNRFLLHV